ncbi:translation initiation factor IF-1 [Sphingobium chlorophenolicum]|uniref:translation initiation factor IF-1 n=1 Tax=Sphingobium chlorophenolicum TaxID=46429 RepID=UPI00056112DB|nr:translation initiation factor IF-1 [Sphingobium chlorophenolicum]
MANEDFIVLDGIIEEIFPDGRFRIHPENELRVIAYAADKMRHSHVRPVVGDRVWVEMTLYDPDKGRIIFRERAPVPTSATSRPKRR